MNAVGVLAAFLTLIITLAWMVTIMPRMVRMDARVPEDRAHCRVMMRSNELIHPSSAADALRADRVPLAASAYLARFTGSSLEHTGSDCVLPAMVR